MMEGTSLQTSFWLMVILQTIGSVDMPGSGPRKMPAPRVFVPIVVAWAVLQLVADTGRERAANAVGWIIVLAGMVVGPFGVKAVGFLQRTATQFAPATQPSPSAPNPYPNQTA